MLGRKQTARQKEKRKKKRSSEEGGRNPGKRGRSEGLGGEKIFQGKVSGRSS